MSMKGRSACSNLASHRGPWKILHFGYLIRCRLLKQGPVYLIIKKSLSLQIVLLSETKVLRAPQWSKEGEITCRKREAHCWLHSLRVWNWMKKIDSLNFTSRVLRRPLTLWEINNSNRCTLICTAIHSCLTNREHRFSRLRIITRRRVSLARSTIREGMWMRGVQAHTMLLTQEKGKKEATMLTQ